MDDLSLEKQLSEGNLKDEQNLCIYVGNGVRKGLLAKGKACSKVRKQERRCCI